MFELGIIDKNKISKENIKLEFVFIDVSNINKSKKLLIYIWNSTFSITINGNMMYDSKNNNAKPIFFNEI